MTTQMFKAKTMKSAMTLVNEEFGDNAVILSTKNSDGLVEIEASDNDEVIKSFPQKKIRNQDFSDIFMKKMDNEKFQANKLNFSKGYSPVDRNDAKSYSEENMKMDMNNLYRGLKEIQNEIKGMVLTDESSLCDSLSYETPIRLRQDNFSSEIINKLNYSYRGKNLDEGKVSFYRELAKRLSSSDFSRILKTNNIFIFGQSGSGKSTLAAKIAAFISDKRNNAKINFIDVSNNSTNHSESLRSYSRVLGFPMSELKNFNFLANKNNLSDNINIFDFCGDINFSIQKINEIKKNFKEFNFCSILAIQSGTSGKMINNIVSKVSGLKPMVAITKLDECWVGSEEFSALAMNNARIGLVTGTKVLIDSIIPANENSLTKYMKENF